MKRSLSHTGMASGGQIVLRVGVGLSMLTCAIGFWTWGRANGWELFGLSTYFIFPLFGILAFSLLWSQYMTLALGKLLSADSGLGSFFKVSGFLVLLCVVLHPGLLVWQLWRDGFGLPPGSYLRHFVPPELGWVALLGTVSLLIFLAYELHRVFGQRSWWRVMTYLCDVAMLAVFYHGFRLGSQLQDGWFRGLWLVYGVLLVAALVYLRRDDFFKLIRKKEES